MGEPKSGKTKTHTIAAENVKNVRGLKIGDKFKGELVDLPGYEFQITGGSDHCGFPMRSDVSGSKRKKLLLSSGVGIRSKRKGLRLRKSIAGNEVFENTAQINVKVLKIGKENLFADPKPEEPAPEEKKEATPEKKE
ncbi:MAG: 30S ribosomal protein S6e [Candidatus Woesearchaeota archaeon]|nr:MAG: 30S ribosomal protein S6e [Candidatus Woesearchaeota archaeon]